MGRTLKQKYHILLRGMMVLCVIGMVISAILLFLSRKEYARGEEVYEQMQLSLREQREDELGSDDRAEDSSGKRTADFGRLQQTNPEVVGWVQEEGGVIDYPIVQGEDNEYYMTHLFNRDRNKLGCLFMDYRNNEGFTDKNTIIYGHNMKDGSMFSSLTGYKKQEHYDSFPAMKLYTPEGDFVIEFFAGIIADGNYEFIRMKFTDDIDLQNYINLLKENSTFESSAEVGSKDRLITLCTCSYEFDNARYALYGKLVPVSSP